MKHLLIAVALMAGPVWAQEAAEIEAADDESVAEVALVSREEGLAAWDRIFEITSHPRCTNCHVGDGGRPMWNDLGYGADAFHGMNVRADESRIGAESVPCRTCHITRDAANAVPHAPPAIDDAWRLPPVPLEWLGKDSDEICNQLRNPETNDDHTIDDLVDHLMTSAFVAWGFAPGAGRSAPGGTPASMAQDVALWGAAGTPCASDR